MSKSSKQPIVTKKPTSWIRFVPVVLIVIGGTILAFFVFMHYHNQIVVIEKPLAYSAQFHQVLDSDHLLDLEGTATPTLVEYTLSTGQKTTLAALPLWPTDVHFSPLHQAVLLAFPTFEKQPPPIARDDLSETDTGWWLMGISDDSWHYLGKNFQAASWAPDQASFLVEELIPSGSEIHQFDANGQDQGGVTSIPDAAVVSFDWVSNSLVDLIPQPTGIGPSGRIRLDISAKTAGAFGPQTSFEASIRSPDGNWLIGKTDESGPLIIWDAHQNTTIKTQLFANLDRLIWTNKMSLIALANDGTVWLISLPKQAQKIGALKQNLMPDQILGWQGTDLIGLQGQNLVRLSHPIFKEEQS